MKPKNFQELIFHSLPKDVKPEEIKEACDASLWSENIYAAIEQALRNSSRINWQAYLENYQDVKAAGMDPISHFINHGVYESRKLTSWHPFHKPSLASAGEAPKVSVVVPSYNNSLFLRKCLNSLVNQTLNEIEIIVVDDCSDDGSLNIAQMFATGDKRIKIVHLAPNQGTHCARKIGVAHATGEYVMFLDADDFYMPTACEEAYKMMLKGYDIGVFECNVINFESNSPDRANGRTKWFSRLPNCVYEGEAKLMLLLEDKLPSFMGNKIIERGLAQECFEKMENFYGVIYEDVYEFLVLNYYSRSLCKTDNILFSYSMNGISNSAASDKFFYNLDAYLQVLKPFQNFCNAHHLEQFAIKFKAFVFDRILRKSNALTTPEACRCFFDSLIRNFGLEYSIEKFMQFYNGKWSDIASKMVYFPINYQNKNKKQNIGIYYYNLAKGHIAQSIQSMCRNFRKADYNVTLFLEEKSVNEIDIDASIKHFYLPSSRDNKLIDQHLSDFKHALYISNISKMFYLPVYMPSLLWDGMLMRSMNISIIGVLELDINQEMLSRGRKYTHSHLLHTLRSISKVICPNISSEIYLRSQGVNAEYIPMLCTKPAKSNVTLTGREDYIIVEGVIGIRRKRTLHCLKVMSEVIKNIPYAKMYFVGDFADPQAKDYFYKKVNDMGLGSNIHVTGWIDNIDDFVDKAKILFSASFMEGYQDRLVHAQASGLPTVMYDIDFDMTIDNESIICVPQGAYDMAAREIIRILSDKKKWQKLAEIAQAKAGMVDDESLIKFVKNYENSSTYKNYDIKDYQRAVRYMSFYAGKNWPTD